MKAAFAVVLLAFAAVATCDRHLLAPTPAPAPSSCPAKQSPGAACLTNAASFQSGCADFITAVSKATSGKVVATTDSQIQALVSQLSSAGSKPSAACCTATTKLLSEACACSTSVQALAKSQQNLSPSEFQTVGKVFLTACNQPTCTDTCVLPSS
jgi:hypothetical protein